MVVRVRTPEGEAAARGLVSAQACWADAGFETRLAVLSESPIDGLDAVCLNPQDLAPHDLARLAAEARIWADDAFPATTDEAAVVAAARRMPPADAGTPLDPAGLREWNGTGGFSADGSEYVIHVTPGPDGRPVLPPLPWTNVLANEAAGAVLSETGATNTWAANSREHRLSPWSNDPVSDPHGEALYVQDVEAGTLWSPTPGPASGGAPYEVRHGFGVTRWRTTVDGIAHETSTVRRPARPRALLTLVTLTNTTDRPRRLAVTAYTQLVLGSLASGSDRFVRTRARGRRGPRRQPDVGRVRGPCRASPRSPRPGPTSRSRPTARRFLGRFGHAEAPAALVAGGALDGRTGAGLDPVRGPPARAQTLAARRDGAGRVRARRGRGRDGGGRPPDALRDARRGRGRARRPSRRSGLTSRGRVQIETPDAGARPRWSTAGSSYQNLACRIWGRTAFYQTRRRLRLPRPAPGRLALR